MGDMADLYNEDYDRDPMFEIQHDARARFDKDSKKIIGGSMNKKTKTKKLKAPKPKAATTKKVKRGKAAGDEMSTKQFTKAVHEDNVKWPETVDVEVEVGHSPFDAREPFDKKKPGKALVHVPPASTSIKPHYVDFTWKNIEEQLEVAQVFLDSGMLPKAVNTPQKVIIINAYARALDIPQVFAYNSLYVVDNKAAMQADLMRGLIFRSYPNATFTIEESTKERCTILAGRPGAKPQRFTFTMDDARQAGLTDKGTWQKYPKALLLARTSSMVARTLFPDVLFGIIYTPEELGAEVSEDGEVLEGEGFEAYDKEKPAVPEKGKAPDKKDPKSTADATVKDKIMRIEYNPIETKEPIYSMEQHELICKLMSSHLVPTAAANKTKAALEAGDLTPEKASAIIDYLQGSIKTIGDVERIIKTTFEITDHEVRYIILDVKNWPKAELLRIAKDGLEEKDADGIEEIVKKLEEASSKK